MKQYYHICIILVIVLVCVMSLGLFGCAAGENDTVNADETPSLNVVNVGEVNRNRIKENTWQLVSVKKDRAIIKRHGIFGF